MVSNPIKSPHSKDLITQKIITAGSGIKEGVSGGTVHLIINAVIVGLFLTLQITVLKRKTRQITMVAQGKNPPQVGILPHTKGTKIDHLE